MGAANSRNVTAEETGLPGRPKKQHFVRFWFWLTAASVLEISPKTSGLPG